MTQQKSESRRQLPCWKPSLTEGKWGQGFPPGVVEEGGARAQFMETHCRCKVIWICGYFQHPQGKSPRLLLHSASLQGRSTSLKPAAVIEAGGPRRVQSLSCLTWDGGAQKKTTLHDSCEPTACALRVTLSQGQMGPEWASELQIRLAYQLKSTLRRFDTLVSAAR